MGPKMSALEVGVIGTRVVRAGDESECRQWRRRGFMPFASVQRSARWQ